MSVSKVVSEPKVFLEGGGLSYEHKIILYKE